MYLRDVVVCDLSGKILFRRDRVTDIDSLALSPDGQKLAFRTRRGLGYFSLPAGEMTLLPGTKEGSRSTGRTIGWSPDSNRIVYEADEQIFIYHLSAQTSTFLAPGDDPTWAPDGLWIAYRTPSPGNQAMLVTASGERSRLLLNGRTIKGRLAWSPDSRHLIFSDNPGQTFSSSVLGALALSPPLVGRQGLIRISDGQETTLQEGLPHVGQFIWVRGGPS